MDSPLISSLLKTVMGRCGLKQKDLAELLGVSLDRIKSLTAGKVHKLTPDEVRRLVQSLNLSIAWLSTGEGEMFNVQGGERAGELLSTLKLVSSRVAALGMDGEEALAARDISYGVAVADLNLVREGLARASSLTDDERRLLENWRRCGTVARDHLLQSSELFAAGAATNPSQPAAKSKVVVKGDVGQQVAGSAFGTKIDMSKKVSGKR